VPAQKLLDYTKAGAIQNQWYTAFEGRDVEFLCLAKGVTVANESIEFRITIDGNLWVQAAATAVNAAEYSEVQGARYTNFPALNLLSGASTASVDVNTNTFPATFLRGRNVKIEIRKTTAAGASALRVVGVYGQW
jgi:hypothetical protein